MVLCEPVEPNRCGCTGGTIIKAIARVWHGRTQAGAADDYWTFLHKRAVPDYRSVPGCLEVRLYRRPEGDVCHFLAVTLWKSHDAIRAFAGENYSRAKYYSEDESYLLEFEESVSHYEVSQPDA